MAKIPQLKPVNFISSHNRACDPYFERKLHGDARGHSLRSRGATWGHLRGQQYKIFKIWHANHISKGNWILNPMGTVNQDRTGHKGQLTGPNWPNGPVQEDRTGPKGQYNRAKLAPRAS